MSKGNEYLKARFAAEWIEMVEDVIAHRNEHHKPPAWTMADFIRIAVREKIDKMARGRGRKLPPRRPRLFET